MRRKKKKLPSIQSQSPIIPVSKDGEHFKVDLNGTGFHLKCFPVFFLTFGSYKICHNMLTH